MHLHPTYKGPSDSATDKIVSAAEAMRLIHDGDTVATSGFVGIGFAEGMAFTPTPGKTADPARAAISRHHADLRIETNPGTPKP